MDAKTYNVLKKIFPLAFALSGNVGQLIGGLAIHILGAPIVSFIVGLIMSITIILIPLAPVVGSLIGIYGWAAAIIEILVFAKVIKIEEKKEETAEETPADAE